MTVSSAEIRRKRNGQWESSEAGELRETQVFKPGPRSEALAGKAARASIASATNTSHVTKSSNVEEQVIDHVCRVES